MHTRDFSGVAAGKQPAVGYGVDLESSGRDVVRRVLAGAKERVTPPIIVLSARTELAARLSSFHSARQTA